jgi:heterodisulfide reductase subunit A
LDKGNRMTDHRVLIIGAGIAGLSAANTLALFGVWVDLVERREVLGGHAAQFACKATDRCVHCGACLVTEAVSAATSDPRIAIHTASRVDAYRISSARFEFRIVPTASATSGDGRTPARPEAATAPSTAAADAVVLATGFDVFDPQVKAYGHGILPNVITNLELEQRLRAEGKLSRPSDGAAPRRVAFIQCVGSRDAKLGHLWCSHFCCAAALRAAKRIKALRPETEISVFYIDIQSFGRDFESFYRQCRQELRFIRAIPSEAFEVEDAGIRLTFSENALHASVEEVFDLVVLSTGMVPVAGLGTIAGRLELRLAPSGYAADAATNGVFTAGAVRGPMTIADSVADARAAAARVLAFLGRHRGLPAQRPAPTGDVCCNRFIPKGA